MKQRMIRSCMWVLVGAAGLLAANSLRAAEGERWTLIHAGMLLAVPGEAPRERQSLVIRDAIVHDVRDGFVEPESIEGAPAEMAVLDLSDRFVLPGLIDCHVHLLTTEGMSMAGLTQWSDAKWALQSIPNLEKTLEAGFTTVRDAGGFNRAIYDLRDAVGGSILPGPRIVASRETLTASAGAGDRRELRPELQPILPPSSVCDGPHDCRRAVRVAIRNGADYIKIKSSAGVFSGTPYGWDTPLYDDELREIVRTAHGMSHKVAAHATTGRAVNDSLRAGVDSIEHGLGLDDESVRLFQKTGAFLVPTLTSGVALSRDGDPESDDPKMRYLASLGGLMKDAVQRAHQGGVRIAFGTDAGVIPHGTNAREFGHLVDAGLTPMEALQTATVNAAELLDLSDEIGSLRPGMAADIIAVPGNPLEDISILNDVEFVMRAGKVVKSRG